MTSTPSAPRSADDVASGRGRRRGRRRSLFSRGEDTLAHAVYGLILTIATLGELIHHEVTSGVAVAWLVGAGAVLLAAHLFSDVLAHMAANHDESEWHEILEVGREDVAVTIGSAVSALIMTAAALFDLDARSSLVACIVLGLVAVASLSYIASSAHRPTIRVAMACAATFLGVVIITLEITF